MIEKFFFCVFFLRSMLKGGGWATQWARWALNYSTTIIWSLSKCDLCSWEILIRWLSSLEYSGLGNKFVHNMYSKPFLSMTSFSICGAQQSAQALTWSYFCSRICSRYFLIICLLNQNNIQYLLKNSNEHKIRVELSKSNTLEHTC